MITTEARKTFELALEEISKIRFYEYEYVGMLKEKRITIKPEEAEICDRRSCNAGDNCIHQVKKKGILFCVY